MNGFTDTRAEIAGKLLAAGVTNPTLNPAASPPCTLVGLGTVDRAAGVGAWGASIPVRILVPPPGDAAAAAELETQLELVLLTLGYAPAVPTYATVGAVDVPCYELTYPRDIPNPNC